MLVAAPGVKRDVISLRRVAITDMKVDVERKCDEAALAAAWKSADVWRAAGAARGRATETAGPFRSERALRRKSMTVSARLIGLISRPSPGPCVDSDRLQARVAEWRLVGLKLP